MTDEYRDTEEVLMIIRKAAMFVDPIMKISATEINRAINSDRLQYFHPNKYKFTFLTQSQIQFLFLERISLPFHPRHVLKIYPL